MSANNAQKLPFAQSISRFAEKKVADAIHILGKALPCHVTAVAGQIVTVAFDITDPVFTLPSITIPINTSVYDWLPIQIGDKGFTAPSDVYLGGVSGLGGGVAGLTLQGNLTALVFTPVSNASWAPPGGDPNMRVIQGPDGVLAQTMDGEASVKIIDGSVVITAAGLTWTFGATGLVLSNGVIAETHIHADAQGGVVGPPENP